MNRNLFNSIKLNKPKKNVFDLTHDMKLSFNMGELVPVCVMEAIPGDKFHLSAESLIRFAPLVSPVMHRMDATIHYFFVPNRLLWENWTNYITNTEVGSPAALPAHPYINVLSDGSNYTRLMDYLGIPDPADNPGASTSENVNALPFAAYQMIYNEYYRDQNLIDPVEFECNDGQQVSPTRLTTLRQRAWEHDYFTSALPWAQKGNAVSIPLGDVYLKDDTFEAGGFREALDHASWQDGAVENLTGAGDPIATIGTEGHVYDPNGTLGVEPTTINDLRRAFRLQEWLEKAARSGSRYVENIFAFFGVKSPDARLQRPEYITGVKTPVVISEVLNTSDTTNAPQGNMAGHGVAVTTGKAGSYFCQEHGFIIGIMSVMPKTAYQQGVPRHFIKLQDPFQYFWPQFAHIGEQEVQLREIYGYTATGSNTFGYVPRYAEYKYMPSRVAGEFRNSLDFWHVGRIFSNAPALNQTFVECVPRTDIFAVTGAQSEKLYAHVLNRVMAVRPMPKFGTPSF